MRSFARGEKAKLGDLTPALQVSVGVSVVGSGSDVFDVSCFGVDAAGKLSDDRYFVFFNQRSSPEGAIVASGASGGEAEVFAVDLARLPATIDRLVFTATLDGSSTMSSVQSGYLRLTAGSDEVARFGFSGADFAAERAVIIGELYRKEVWRFAAVGQGFNGGLSALLKHFGGEEAAGAAPPPPPAPTPTPPRPTPAAPTPAAPKVQLGKVTLEKRGETRRVSLRKDGNAQPLHFNLNWTQQQKQRGILSGRGAAAADLDLGCMLEMSDGSKNVIQPLGGNFGSQSAPPYIFLDKDDRSGAAQDGENLYIYRPDLIRRVLVFGLIYEGAPDFMSVDGRLTIRDQEGNETLVQLNSPDPGLRWCAICMVTNDVWSRTMDRQSASPRRSATSRALVLPMRNTASGSHGLPVASSNPKMLRHFPDLGPDADDALFEVPPTPFDRAAPSAALGVGLGATLYTPGTHCALGRKLAEHAALGLTTAVICLEDAIGDGELPEAIATTRRALCDLRHREMLLPLLFVRVPGPHEMTQVIDGLEPVLPLVTGLVLPKFSSESGARYLDELNALRVPDLSLMPVLEGPEVLYVEQRVRELLDVRELLETVRSRVVAVRVGATDLCGLLGLRRRADESIYDISPVRECVADISNVMGRDNPFVVSGPAWEHFAGDERLWKPQLRASIFDSSRFAQPVLRQVLLSEHIDGLIKEARLDLAAGLVGKTVVHPSHIRPVNALHAVSHEEWVDATAIVCAAGGGVQRSSYGNKMNEPKPHRRWAERALARARAFGVLRSGVSIFDLLAA